MKIFANNKLDTCNLVVDAVYEGTDSIKEEPINKLMSVGNQGGFRKKGNWENPNLVVLCSTLEDIDWPDQIDVNTGIFTYYGDNKKPGYGIHQTPLRGNSILSRAFDVVHNDDSDLSKIPPFFIFTKYPTKNSQRSYKFRGLAVPGHPSLTQTQDLVAIWKSTKGQRFQNYQAHFSILNVGELDRRWINDLIQGNKSSLFAPKEWVRWQKNKSYSVLTSEPVINVRTKEEQVPDSKLKQSLINFIHQRYSSNPAGFEHFAARLFEMFDSRVKIDEVTQASVDGGRDAIGTYKLGIKSDPVNVTFFLEAKCYDSNNPVGVKELSRLISRIRNRQFGVMVTTSYIGNQAYTEVRQDRHPIIIITGKDIAEILIEHNYNSIESLTRLCESVEYY